MLKQLGRLERTRNIVILGFAILMAVSLVFFYAPGRSAAILDPTRNTEAVARVGSDTITVAELARRRAAWTPPASHGARGYVKLYVDHVLQANDGVDLDFLVGRSGSAVPRDNH